MLVAANGPWDLDAALTSLRTHSIAGVDSHDGARMRHTRVLRLDGEPRIVEVRLQSDGVFLSGLASDEVETVAQRWFDLDTDIEEVDAHLASSAVFAEHVRERPGIRITRYLDDFEAAVSVVLGQQVTLAAGRTFIGRLVAAYGEPVRELIAFPVPATIAQLDLADLRDALGVTRSRAATVHAVAQLYADGFRLLRGPDRERSLAELGALPGIGPWTLTTLALRVLDDGDAFPASDAVVRRALAKFGLVTTDPGITAWAPYRSYATVRLWNMDS